MSHMYSNDQTVQLLFITYHLSSVEGSVSWDITNGIHTIWVRQPRKNRVKYKLHRLIIFRRVKHTVCHKRYIYECAPSSFHRNKFLRNMSHIIWHCHLYLIILKDSFP